MTSISDRLYGELRFPNIVGELVICPGLLRLREVRMANVPFIKFPSFSAVSRYEHSLGVSYLAGLCADRLDLCERDKLELMIASLYHDVGTPPFAHAVEEVFRRHFGFDHERNLYDLITGKAIRLGGHRAQVFLGRSLRLQTVLQSARARRLGLDPFRIADIATGSGKSWLGSLICSAGIDLDNIDNVIRATTAMGIGNWSGTLPRQLAVSFVQDRNTVALDATATNLFTEWQRARQRLYQAIYDDVFDFSLQTMLKKAVEALMKDSPGSHSTMCLDDWSLTDEELVQHRLMKHPVAGGLISRVRLGQAFVCLSIVYVQGLGVAARLAARLPEIEVLATDVFARDAIGQKARAGKELGIVANYFLDKRVRPLSKALSFMGTEIADQTAAESEPGAILGVFTSRAKPWTMATRMDFEAKLGNTILESLSIQTLELAGGVP